MKMRCGLAGSHPVVHPWKRKPTASGSRGSRRASTSLRGSDAQRRTARGSTRPNRRDRPRAAARPAVHAHVAPAAVLATALTAVGCAAPTQAPWTVEPVYRTHNATLQPAGNASAYAEVARMFEYEARWGQAVQWWQKAASVDRPDPDHVTSLGAALLQLGQREAAVAAFARAAELQPGNARALNNHAYALALTGQPEQAAPLLRQALSIDPTHARAQANLAWVDQQIATAGRSGPRELAATPPAGPTAATANAPSAGSATTADPVAAVTRVAVSPSFEDIVNREPPAAGSSVSSRSPSSEEPSPAVAAQQQTPDVTGRAVATSESAAAAPVVVPAPTVDAAATSVPARSIAPGRLAIANGVGITGAAAGLDRHLASQGLVAARLQNVVPYRTAETTIEYRPGFGAAARQVARSMPASTTLVETPTLDARFDVRVVLGHDRKEVLESCARQPTCASPTTAGAIAPRRS
jgi:Flp pilus assembly protein TadD